MAEWYYQSMGETVGPVSWIELEQKAKDGEIGPESQVREGIDGPWTAAGGVPGLLDAPAESGDEAAGVDDSGVGVQRSPLSLRPCSDCGRMVSKQASICPECGRAFRESSLTARYGGEQPVLMFVLILLLAAAFLFLSPVAVYFAALKLAPNFLPGAESPDLAYNLFALSAVVLYVFAMLACTFVGGAVGRPRMAYVTGCLLGLFFGPLGVFAAFAIDKRPLCPQCSSRLNGLAQECPYCRARLIWKVVPTWY